MSVLNLMNWSYKDAYRWGQAAQHTGVSLIEIRTAEKMENVQKAKNIFKKEISYIFSSICCLRQHGGFNVMREPSMHQENMWLHAERPRTGIQTLDLLNTKCAIAQNLLQYLKPLI